MKSISIRLIKVLTVLMSLVGLAGACFAGFSDRSIAGIKPLSSILAAVGLNTGQTDRYRVILMIEVLFLLFLAVFAYRWLKKLSERRLMVVSAIVAVCMVALQMILVSGFDLTGMYDSYEVMDQALAIAQGRQTAVNYSRIFYFQKYSNNNFILLLYTILLRLAIAFHITAYNRFLIVINVCFVDAAIFFLCASVRIEKDRCSASYVLLLNAFNPLNYLYVVWTYTATMSLLPMMAGIFLIELSDRRQMRLSGRIITAVLLGADSAVCLLIRPTAFFPVIAYLLIKLVRLLHGIFSIKKFCLLLISFVCFMSVFTVLNRASLRLNPDQSENFPLTHWLMMGACGDGRADRDLMTYTRSFRSKEEKSAANVRMIKQALSERGFSGNVKFLMKKMMITWSDGISNYRGRYSMLRGCNSAIYKRIVGTDSAWLLTACQAVRIVMLALAVIGIAMSVKREGDFLYSVACISVFGAMFFYLFWEGKNVYSIPFIPLFAILILPAAEKLSSEETVLKTADSAFIPTVAAALALFVVCSLPGMNAARTYSPSILTRGDAFYQALRIKQDGSVSQEFTSVNPANYLKVATELRDKSCGEARYRVTLTAGGKTVVSQVFKAEEIKNRILIHFPLTRSEEKCTLTIKNLTDKKRGLSIYAAASDALQLYDGKTIVNGKERISGRLLIDVLFSRRSR